MIAATLEECREFLSENDYFRLVTCFYVEARGYVGTVEAWSAGFEDREIAWNRLNKAADTLIPVVFEAARQKLQQELTAIAKEEE